MIYLKKDVPIAQPDRALDSGSKGRRFESSWVQNPMPVHRVFLLQNDAVSAALFPFIKVAVGCFNHFRDGRVIFSGFGKTEGHCKT